MYLMALANLDAARGVVEADANGREVFELDSEMDSLALVDESAEYLGEIPAGGGGQESYTTPHGTMHVIVGQSQGPTKQKARPWKARKGGRKFPLAPPLPAGANSKPRDLAKVESIALKNAAA